jgi:hypothetical protein
MRTAEEGGSIVNRSRTKPSGLIILLLLGLVSWAPAWGAEAPDASLKPSAVPAAGTHHALLEVSGFGRFAVTVASESGVAVRSVGRMTGPGEWSGTAGEQDGRIDLFLDRGEYRIDTDGHAKATGNATLAVHPFRELNSSPAPRLVEVKPVETSLGDFEQRSYWLEIKEAREVALEAAGRYLTDLRLWRAGVWLLDATPEIEVVNPQPGRPRLACRLAAHLEPGLYLLTAYGGAGQPWADDDGSGPLWMRWGIPSLPAVGRSRHTIGPAGIDRWLVPASTNFFRAELEEARPLELRVGSYQEKLPFAAGANRADITKKSRQPVAEVRTSSVRNGLVEVTVSGEAGQPYVLQHFEVRSWYPVESPPVHGRARGSGTRYWVASVHSGDPRDSVDATAIVARYDRCRQLQSKPAYEQVETIGALHAWQRRFNLLAPLTLFMRVEDAGTYRVDLDGVEARYRFEPLLVSRPRDYRKPNLQAGGTTWELDPGYWVLTIEPEEKGIVTATVRADGAPKPVERAPLAAVRFPDVEVGNDCLRVFLNNQPGVTTGLVVRPLPVDLEEPLPLSLRPQESVTVPVHVAEPGHITARGEDGGLLEVSVDDGQAGKRIAVLQGDYTVAVRNPGRETMWASLGLEPSRLAIDTPLPPVPDATLAALPSFPELRAGTPAHFDLRRNGESTYLVRAEHDGLYRLVTTGLIDTSGALRSRTVIDLASARSGGSGRNFSIQQYLGSGIYQLTVRQIGRSAGHLGLALQITDPEDGGALADGVPARVTAPAGTAVAYRFKIAEVGRYRLRALGLGRIFRCRLEDSDGWPLLRPGGPADIDLKLDAGAYRLILLPEPVTTRRVTLLERVTKPPEFSGHGPHALPLDQQVKNVWMEPAEGAARVPDAWDLTLPAEVEVTVQLSQGMRGVLLDSGGNSVAKVTGGRGLKRELRAGAYRLEVTSARPNSRFPYTLLVRPSALVAGLERPLRPPAELPVAVGRGGLTELESFGQTDVRARLVNAAGHTVAWNDDRPNDWNFDLTARAVPGLYRLLVSPAGGRSGSTVVRMSVRREIEGKPLRLPADETVSPGEDAIVRRLPEEPGRLLIATARAHETVGLALEAAVSGGWREVARSSGETAHLAVLQGDGAHRLRLWSLDRRGGPVKLRVTPATPRTVDEHRLASGVRLRELSGIDPPLAALRVLLTRPGTLRLEDTPRNLLFASGDEQPLREPARGLLPAGNRDVVLLGEKGAHVRAARVTLDAAQITLSLGGEPAVLDLTSGPGGAVAVVHAQRGQPRLELAARGSAHPAFPDAVAVASGATLAVADRADQLAARVWTSEPGPTDLAVRVIPLSEPERAPARWGIQSGTVTTKRPRRLVLPSGRAIARLTLSPDTVAAHFQRERVRDVHWGGGAALEETFAVAGGELLLARIGDGDGAYRLELLPTEDSGLTVAPGIPFERMETASGVLRLTLDGAPGHRLRLGGVATSATVVSVKGEVERGTDLAASTGTLLIEHGPGLVAAWLGPADAPEGGLWPAADHPEVHDAELPARLGLGPAQRCYRFTLAEPRLLRIVSDAAAVVRLQAAGLSRCWLDPSGGAHELYVPAGAVEVALRAVAGGTLSGRLELTTTAVDEVGEGLGPEVLLAPGSAHAFRFVVPEAGRIGVGVRADTDVVEAELVDEAGRRLGRGIVQLADLDAGGYLLVVRVPDDAVPVRIRPAVVGLERPATGPPEEVIRRYVKMESPGGSS